MIHLKRVVFPFRLLSTPQLSQLKELVEEVVDLESVERFIEVEICGFLPSVLILVSQLSAVQSSMHDFIGTQLLSIHSCVSSTDSMAASSLSLILRAIDPHISQLSPCLQLPNLHLFTSVLCQSLVILRPLSVQSTEPMSRLISSSTPQLRFIHSRFELVIIV